MSQSAGAARAKRLEAAGSAPPQAGSFVHAGAFKSQAIEGSGQVSIDPAHSDHPLYQDWTSRDWPEQVVGGPAKRAFDCIVAMVLLIFLAPVLAVIALTIFVQDGGSPIFAHLRVGAGGRPFRCFKFRSMVTDGEARLAALFASNPAALDEWSRTRKLMNDPRVTRVGQVLRKRSLDELPQLLNVLRGDMSLVGPRPIVADELNRYGLDRVHYLRARPGLTGLWQVSGRSLTTYDRRVALDKSYALNWSLSGDLVILARTIPTVLLRRGAL
ncbi:MAG: sugar transferase [Alphaproteobacteria bacterium]|nr:sugar transferase [Alphaproteobacteria bacterium]